MNCQHALNEIGRLIDGELPAAERGALEAHLADCGDCRAARDGLRLEDAELLRAFMPRRQAAAALADRVIEQLHDDWRPRLRRRSWASPIIAAAAGFLLAAIWFRGAVGRLPGPAVADELPLARLSLATGPTEIRPLGHGAWLTCPPNGEIGAGASVRTPASARCEIQASDGTQIRLQAGTEVQLPKERSVKLTRGELYSSVARNGPPFEVVTPDAKIQAAHGKFDFSCSPGQASLTVIEGLASVECKSGACQVGPGERVRLVDGRLEDAVSVGDALQATAWINELLLLKGADNPELLQRLDDILAQIGQTKASYLYEDEIRRLGSPAALPLLRYVASPRSQGHEAARLSAARIAADLADATVIGDLIGLLTDNEPRVRVYAARALERLTGRDQGRPAAAWQEDRASCQPNVEAWHAWRSGDKGELRDGGE